VSGPTRRDVVVAGHTGDLSTVRAGLGADDATVRAAALGALERLDDLTDADLAAALTDTSEVVRRRAVELAATRPQVDLRAALDDPDTTVVETAAWACGEHEVVSDDVLDRLVTLTTTADDPLVREAAAAALGAIGDERGLPAILAACTDKPAIRRRAVLARAPFDGPEVDAALDRALQDRDWQVRQSAEDLRRALPPS
jgi:HEAT repeat protein